MSKWVANSSALKTVIQGVQQSGEAAFVEVLEHPSNEFSGYPSATVLPAATPSGYSTNTQNRRPYTFDVFIYISLNDLGYQAAFDQMRELNDLVVDAIDQTKDLNGATDFVHPVPSEWGESTVAGGAVLISSLQVVCEEDVDVGF